MSNEFDIYGDADTGDAAEDGGPDAGGDASAASPPTGDGSPGAPVPGYPGLRAGVFGPGGGVLGLYRAADGQDAGSTGASLTPAAYFGKGPEVLPDYQTKSWRWNDPEAMAYDADRKQGQVGQVQGMVHALEALGGSGLLGPWASRAAAATTALMGYGEAAHLQDQHDALQARQKQLKAQGRS